METCPKLLPRNRSNLAGMVLGHPSFDLSGPRLFGVRIALIVQTLQQQRGQLGTIVSAEFCSLRIKVLDGSGHGPILP